MMRRYRNGIPAFLIPFCIALLICIVNRVYPFGENCLLHIDMYHQYCPFFTEFSEKLKHGGSLFYTWNLGLGSDYVSLYAYYLASPLNWLLIVCPKGMIIEFMELAILLKIGFCGYTMNLFLRNHLQKQLNADYMLLVFSSAYALCGFVAAYSWDIMWMDTVALAPLVVLGLERLVLEKKAALYSIALAFSIWSNYYIAIMLCIFLVFYFLWVTVVHLSGAGLRAAALARFAVYSLLAGAVSAVIILPEIAVLSYSGSSMGTGFPEKMEWYFNLLAEVSRMNTAASVYTGLEHWPNLYCGAFCTLLFTLYFLNRRIPWNHKIPALLLAVLFVVSFSNNYLDFVWHGLHFPESLPGRQSYLFAFFVVTVAATTWRERSALSILHILFALILTAAFILAGIFVGDGEVTEKWTYAVTILFVSLYEVILISGRLRGSSGHPVVKHVLAGLFMVAALGELALNMAVTGLGVTSRTAYTEADEDYAHLLRIAQEEEKKQGNPFYRMEDVERNTKNDSSYHSYSSTTIFSSLMNLDVSHFYQSLYMEGGKNYYCYNGATPLTSALLGVDYVISEDELSAGEYRKLIAKSGKQHLYQNMYSLPIGFMIDGQLTDQWDNAYDIVSDRVSNMNELASLLGADEDYLASVDTEQKPEKGTTVITIPEDGYYFMGYINNTADRLYMETSEGYRRTFSKTSHRYLLEVGQCVAGERITIKSYDEQVLAYQVYRVSDRALRSAFERLSGEPFQLEAMTDTSVEGTVNTKGGQLVFSIPADPGWTMSVDGKEVEIKRFCDAFISVNLKEGEHTVKLVYRTPYLREGASVSLTALVLMAVLLSLGHVRRRGRKSCFIAACGDD